MTENILTFDVEEWFDVEHCRVKRSYFTGQGRAEIGVYRILSFLRPRNIKATFFVLGSVAEKNPHIIKEIDSHGHEVATHGYLHRFISEQTPQEFEGDLLRSIKVLKSITRKEILGFRAPGYSITKETLWALEIIECAGLKYDSSIYPVNLRLFTKGGISGYPRQPFFIRKNLFEFPLITLGIFGLHLPVATTAYFRIFPYAISSLAIRRLDNEGIPAVINFHSWEFDKSHPRVALPFPHNIKHYYNLRKIESRFNRLTTDFKFVACRDKLPKQ